MPDHARAVTPDAYDVEALFGALALRESLPVIGNLLGHTQAQTTAPYAQLARLMFGVGVQHR